ncbi:hypothetical protein D9M69_687480 [compost metagenome]
MCFTSRPLSSTRVFNPFSQSSLAAQPPLIPEPITMASNVRSFTESILMLGIIFLVKVGTADVAARDKFKVPDIGHYIFRGIIPPNGQVL